METKVTHLQHKSLKEETVFEHRGLELLKMKRMLCVCVCVCVCECVWRGEGYERGREQKGSK